MRLLGGRRPNARPLRQGKVRTEAVAPYERDLEAIANTAVGQTGTGGNEPNADGIGTPVPELEPVTPDGIRDGDGTVEGNVGSHRCNGLAELIPN